MYLYMNTIILMNINIMKDLKEHMLSKQANLKFRHSQTCMKLENGKLRWNGIGKVYVDFLKYKRRIGEKQGTGFFKRQEECWQQNIPRDDEKNKSSKEVVRRDGLLLRWRDIFLPSFLYGLSSVWISEESGDWLKPNGDRSASSKITYPN